MKMELIMTPMSMAKIICVFTWILCLYPSYAFADDTTAVYFAKQAGVIAGAAEACGQPISLMVMRSGEVINALSINPMDNTYATAAFERTRQDAHTNMAQSQNITCAQVISDFNRLPLLQPDYRTTVLQPLLANTPQASANNTGTGLTASGAATANPTATLPAAKTNPTDQSTSPTQNYVMGTPPSQNPATVPPINPTYNANGTTTSPAQSNTQNTEMAKLQLAQQLAQMAQTLVSNNQTQIYAGPGVPSINNPAYNSQLNEQLYGIGSNNPIFTGAPLTPTPGQNAGK